MHADIVNKCINAVKQSNRTTNCKYFEYFLESVTVTFRTSCVLLYHI